MRTLGLDLVRLAAVLLVMGRHLRLPRDDNFFLQALHRGGWVGVDLFFVLSGFLVSGLLFAEHSRRGTVSVKTFLIRRGFKIYPPFWVLILVTTSLSLLRSQEPISLRGLVGELLFLQNYVGGLWGHTWSLAVEEHFYIGLAILIVALARRPATRFAEIPMIFLILAVACLSLRIITLWTIPEYSHQAYLYGTHIRIDSLFFGVLLSYLVHYRGLLTRVAPIPASAFLLSGVLLLSPAFIFELETSRWIPVAGVILFYIASGLIVLGALRLASTRSRLLALCGTLGAASYSIYLWHMPMNTWAPRLVSKLTHSTSFGQYALVYVLGTVLFGFLMSKIVEIPFLRLRDLLYPSESKAHRISPESVTPPDHVHAAGSAVSSSEFHGQLKP